MNVLSSIIGWLRNPNLFILIPILLLIYIVSSGAGTLMEKFGFKTKETYRVLYMESQKNLQIARDDIAHLTDKLAEKDKMCKIREEILDNNKVSQDEIDQIIKDALEHLNKKDISIPPINFNYIKEQPKLEDDQIASQRNIVSINNAFNQLYGA